MKIKNIENNNVIIPIVFFLGCIWLISIVALDRLYWGTHILAEGSPNFSTGHILRSILIIISILAIFWSLIGSRKPKLILDENNRYPFEQLSILGTMLFSIVILFLFIFETSIFNALSLEDGIIENVSAILLFSSCIIAAISFLRSRNISNIPKGTQLSFAFLALVFFVMTMEEVSWFQRVLEVETPKLFTANIQNEINLHNFYTNPVENIYYFGAFIFLVVLSFFRLLFPYISNNNYLRIFVPRPFIGIIGSIACAYNFDMWNIIFTQIAFFSSVIILMVFFVFSRSRNEASIILFTVLLITSTQLLFLINGTNFARSWEVTEYKEFLIPLAFFIYSLDVFTYISNEHNFQKKASKCIHSDS